MEEGHVNSPEPRVIGVVRRVLAERSITREIGVNDDLGAVGLTSIDMISLVLSVEAEFNLTIPERDIKPANFRSISAMSSLVASRLAEA